MARQRPHLAAVPPPAKPPRKPRHRAKRAPLLNRNCSPERIAELRARLKLADNARPRAALRQEGPEHVSLGRREFVVYDLLDMAPLALRGGVAVERKKP